MAKRANLNSALLALSNGLPYRVARYNRRDRVHEIVAVQPGDGCVRIMQSLASFLGHNRVPTDIHAEAVQTPSQLRGQFPGSALWTSSLFKTGDEQLQDGEWQLRVGRCPDCWDGDTLDDSIDCSQYLRVPMVASCGVGRLKGGDVKSVTKPGPRDEWALGSGGGDNVEVHKQPSAGSRRGVRILGSSTS
ncbi:unnamed protein product [Ectocarpus sp. CCAP 1310/34]|nr:unnamed protein product [Ectocarpus sp. CCAP 1310/34]